MKFLGVTVILSLFAAGAATIRLDRRYPTQDSRQETSMANRVATLCALRSSRGIPISSLHTRAINGSEAPTSAHSLERWPEIERARGTTLIAMDEHPLEWHVFNRRTGPRRIGTYGLEESLAVIVLDQQRVLLVHKSMRKWQADGVTELEAALPHELRDAVAYIARPSECTLSRWSGRGHRTVSMGDYERITIRIKDLLQDRGIRRRARTVGFGTTRDDLRSQRGTALVEVISPRGEVAPRIWVDGSELRPRSNPQWQPAPPATGLHYPAPLMYAPHPPVYVHPPAAFAHHPPGYIYPPPVYAHHPPGYVYPPPAYAQSPPMYAVPPPTHMPYPPVPDTQWAYNPLWHTPWQQPPGQVPQNLHAHNPYGYNNHGH